MDANDSVVEQVATVARAAADSRPLAWWARLGLGARGLVWLLMGILALLVASGGRAEVDQKGALAAVVARPFGGFVVLLMGVGFAGYAVWRLGEAAFGVVGDGRRPSARLVSLGRGVAYLVLSATAFSVLAGSRSSQAGQQRTLTAQALAAPGGRLVVGVVGLVVVGVGVVLMVEGGRRTFLRYLDHSAISSRMRHLARVTGTVGSLVRGAVVALAGVYLIGAAWTEDGNRATGVDGAVKSLRDMPGGQELLVLVGVGLMLFGCYGLMEARYRRV